jgi:hypothetical protein
MSSKPVGSDSSGGNRRAVLVTRMQITDAGPEALNGQIEAFRFYGRLLRAALAAVGNHTTRTASASARTPDATNIGNPIARRTQGSSRRLVRRHRSPICWHPQDLPIGVGDPCQHSFYIVEHFLPWVV